MADAPGTQQKVRVRLSDGTVVYKTMAEIQHGGVAAPKKEPEASKVVSQPKTKQQKPKAQPTVPLPSQPVVTSEPQRGIQDEPDPINALPFIERDAVASPPKKPKQKTYVQPKQTREKSQPNAVENTHLPVKTGSQELSTTTPVDDYFVDLAKAHEWSSTDHTSLLEEAAPDKVLEHTAASPLPKNRYEDVQSISEALSFTIPTELHGRLHSLIQSRIKDIRNDAQIESYVTQAVAEGGLGLDATQAKVLVDTIHKTLAIKNTAAIPAPHKTALQFPPTRTRPPSHAPRHPQPGHTPAQSPRVSLQDIHPPTKQEQTMGPIDEIKSMTLQDFRRLSEDPHSAIEILKEKIETIRDESYLDYLKAQDAWFHSTLYGIYLAHLGQALEKQNTLRDVLDGDLTPDDISVISRFSESLRF